MVALGLKLSYFSDAEHTTMELTTNKMGLGEQADGKTKPPLGIEPELREAIFRKPYVWETRFPAEPTPPASNFRYEAEQEGNTMNKEQRNITMREALLRDIADLKRERDEALEIAAKYEDRYFSTLKERDEARDVLRIFADCRNWFHTAKEEGGPYTAWRGKREPDEIAEAALKEAAK